MKKLRAKRDLKIEVMKEVADEIWLFSFMGYDLGYFDQEPDRVEPGPNPFV